MNLWHDIAAGTENEMNVIIEIPRGSSNKYEIDKATGLITLDRAAHTAQVFPYDYGFVPQTLWDDGDALDVVVLTTYPLLPGILVRTRPVALLKMIDGGEPDDKIVAVPTSDPRWDEVRDLPHLNSHTLKEMTHFYSTYKKLQNKEVAVSGFEPAAAARQAFARGIANYQQKFIKNKRIAE